jgi:Sugar-specific transcriptional regulator TrmB
LKRRLCIEGAATKQTRAELAEAVERLFAGRRQEPRDIGADEIKRIGDTVALMVRLRGAVERDRGTRELDIVYGAEGPARVGLALERLLAGLDTLGVERGAALDVVVSVALASVPPQRRQAYELAVAAKRSVTTSEVATVLGLPTNTVRRVLEDLAADGLIKREGGEPGKADKWTKAIWEAEE